MSLRTATQALHTQAERSGVVRELLRGTITRDAYGLYLRSLLPAYRALEEGLENRRKEVVVAGFARRELYRTSAIEADLAALCGTGWSRALPVLPAASSYALLIEAAGREASGSALVAHSYVRYFGDLSGGQILRRLLARSLRLPDAALSLYEFLGIADLEAFKSELREAVDAAGRRLASPQRVIDEALHAFRASIEISQGVEIHTMSVRAPAAER